MTQAPTPGPLSASDVKLLVKGDLLLCKTWGVVRFDRFDDSGVRAFVLDLANDQVRLMKPINMAFIGRPDADGWMPWSGGENLVPGQRVDAEGSRFVGKLRDTPSDQVRWDRVARFRLAPTAPVEASGSERDFGDIIIDCEIAREAFDSRPQPSGETRADESLDDVARRLFAAQYPDRDYDSLKDMVQIGWLRKAHEEILSARPLALGGQQGEVEDILSKITRRDLSILLSCEQTDDPIGRARETLRVILQYALSATPARAEALKEGDRLLALAAEADAAGEYDQAFRLMQQASDAARAEAQDEGAEGEPAACPKCGFFSGDDWKQCSGVCPMPGSPHPSPTPAADADRVLREAGWSVAVHNDYRLNGEAHTFWLWTHPDGHWIKGEGKTDAEALTQCAEAIAALKSEGK